MDHRVRIEPGVRCRVSLYGLWLSVVFIKPIKDPSSIGSEMLDHRF